MLILYYSYRESFYFNEIDKLHAKKNITLSYLYSVCRISIYITPVVTHTAMNSLSLEYKSSITSSTVHLHFLAQFYFPAQCTDDGLFHYFLMHCTDDGSPFLNISTHITPQWCKIMSAKHTAHNGK